MAGSSSDVPDVAETELGRADLEDAAQDMDIEGADELDDQELFERIGFDMGELSQEQVDHPEDAAADEADDDAGDEATDDTPEADADAGDGSDAAPVSENDEYRVEDDPRENIEPVLDLELGPVALDVLGVEVHLKRLHASLVANPSANRNAVGKLLARVAKAREQLPGGGDDGGEGGAGPEEEPEEQDDGGLLHKVTSPVRGLARSAKDTVKNTLGG